MLWLIWVYCHCEVSVRPGSSNQEDPGHLCLKIRVFFVWRSGSSSFEDPGLPCLSSSIVFIYCPWYRWTSCLSSPAGPSSFIDSRCTTIKTAFSSTGGHMTPSSWLYFCWCDDGQRLSSSQWLQCVSQSCPGLFSSVGHDVVYSVLFLTFLQDEDVLVTCHWSYLNFSELSFDWSFFLFQYNCWFKLISLRRKQETCCL